MAASPVILRAELRDTPTEDTPTPHLTAFAVRGSFHTIFFSKKLKARIVFFILPVAQTLPFICLFCLLSFGTIEKKAYLCSVVNKPSLLMRFSYLTKVKAVGRLPFLLSVIERQAKERERAEPIPIPPPKARESQTSSERTANTNLTRCRYGLYQPKMRGQNARK